MLCPSLNYKNLIEVGKILYFESVKISDIVPHYADFIVKITPTVVCKKSIENFIFRPKMAIFHRARMREATPTSFSIFDSYDMKSL